MRLLIAFLFVFQVFTSVAQQAQVYGKVLDKDGKPFNPAVNVSVQGASGGVATNSDGSYKLIIPANKDVILHFSHVSFNSVNKSVYLLVDEKLELNIVLDKSIEVTGVDITAKRHEYDGINRIDPKEMEYLPVVSGDAISGIVKQMPGVASRNEMSSQYSVRGGNFDENLVYVNGIEVPRPMLIKSGQQEGLPFPNSDLVKSINFSAGGFDAYYGDKMSSVLDIEYRRPKKFAGSFAASLLGGSVHVEGVGAKQRFRYLIGVRYKTNNYVLKSLDTDGDFKTNATDVQSFLSYDVTEEFEISFLGNYAVNNYQITPQNRETNFGSLFEALRFTVYFDGHEVDRFQSYMGALTGRYHKRDLDLRLTVSAYRTLESETYDIMGQYWLDVLENDLGKDDFGQVAFNKGVGTYLDHARNYLDGRVISLQHRGSYQSLSWGAIIRHDIIDDQLNEWSMLDSAGFVLPHPKDNVGDMIPGYTRPNEIKMNEVIRSNNYISSNRYSAYVQNQWIFQKSDTVVEYKLNAGARVNYWDFSNEVLLSPRLSLLIKPHWKKNVGFRLATGIYSQPAIYREMRGLDGQVNQDIKAQKSLHFVAGSDFVFKAWDRPFKFTTEVYYKYMWDLIPYEIDDVRIRYFAENNAVGYATGIDLKLNGEFVKNAESWVGISLMKTMEDIKDDYYFDYFNAAGEKIQPGITVDNTPVDSSRVEPGFIPRPTDQRFSFNLFFQDYMPGYPTFKVHLNLVYATGLPFGPPTHKRYQQTRRYPAYRRVDIGFSKQLIGEDTEFRSKNPLRHFKSVWVSVEVFNLLQIDNTLSYMWISDVNGAYYGIPNYLTSRQLNIRLSVKF
jgi:hypothetical protein